MISVYLFNFILIFSNLNENTNINNLSKSTNLSVSQTHKIVNQLIKLEILYKEIKGREKLLILTKKGENIKTLVLKLNQELRQDYKTSRVQEFKKTLEISNSRTLELSKKKCPI